MGETADDIASEVLDVAILGAGAAGLCTAIKLDEAGRSNYQIFERSDGVGGTWRANTYPGAACDIPSHLYSFSFAPKRDWTRRFAEQSEILSYFEQIADRFGLRGRIRCNTEVTAATFDEIAGVWSLTLGDGSVAHARIVVSGLGQLNTPQIPEIDGQGAFVGEQFHSARWNHELDLSDKRVAVVGNGASAVQFIPRLAQSAQHVTVFQRSANWILPKPDEVFSDRTQRLFKQFPAFERLYRWRIYLRLEANVALMRANSLLGRQLAKLISRELHKLVTDDLPGAALIPDYLPGCKRILISNDYYPALRSDAVDVELSHIASIEPSAIVTEDGNRHEVDVIVYGTGFATTEFLAPMSVLGRGGRDLNDAWERGAEAHLGISVPGFPNFFMLYGPNTNLGHNSIIFMIEAQSRYIVRAIEQVFRDDVAWIDVRQDAMDSYRTEIQRAADNTVWASDCSSWYKNEHGRITNNWPKSSVAYWKRLRSFQVPDYISRPAVRT